MIAGGGRWLVIGVTLMSISAQAQEPIRIADRLEPLVDEFLVESLTGGARQVLHRPVRREIVFRTDQLWEGNASAFQSIFRDGEKVRLYYRGLHYRHGGEPALALADHPWYLCYAESDDGVRFRRPELELFEFNGSRANNIVLTPAHLAEIGGDPAHTAAFLDANPACPPDQRYKIVVVGSKPRGLYCLVSGDGVRFTLLSRQPMVTEGAFDSQNLAFWDPTAKVYREYHRGFHDGVRAILTSTSPDLVTFTKPDWLKFPGAASEHLYTNQVQPYYRAPHLLMGFPMRYVDRGWSEPVLSLPGSAERLARGESHPRYGSAVTDALFMTSRDGTTFRRWPEAFIRPGPRQRESWVYGDNFVFWGMIETPATVEDAPPELSLYATESYWQGTSTAFRRYTIRLDGFVSIQAPLSGGELVTRPLLFEGGNLALNFATSAAGSIRVEVQTADGSPVAGHCLDDCPPIYGDSVEQIVRWDGTGGDLRPFSGQPVRLRFELRDADLYSLRFTPYQPDPERPDLVGKFGVLPPKNRRRGAFVIADTAFDAVPAAPWQVVAGSPDRVRLTEGRPPGPERYLTIERRQESYSQGGALWLVPEPQDVADATAGAIEVTARLMVPAGNRSKVDIDAYDAAPGEFTRRAFHLRIAPDGVVQFYRGSDQPVTGLAVTLGEWTTVRLVADLKAGTFDLTVGDRTVTGLPFAQDEVHRIRSICFGPNSAQTTLHLASVKAAARP